MTGIMDDDQRAFLAQVAALESAGGYEQLRRARRVRQLQAEFEADWLARILPGTRLRLTTSHAAIVAGGAV